MFKLKIVTPERIVHDGDAISVLVPGVKGQFEILSGHAPIISALNPGTVDYATSEGHQQLQITGGFVEVTKKVVNLCVEC